MLQSLLFIVRTFVDPENHLTHMFFTHPDLLEMYRLFPSVLLIDCTYKVNSFKLNLLEIVAFTCHNTSFSLGFALVQGESSEDYRRIIGVLVDILLQFSLPNPGIFVTDRDLALLGALRHWFQSVPIILCIFHIQRDVLRVCKTHFTGQGQEAWETFHALWNKVINSATETEFSENWAAMQHQYNETHEACIQYLSSTWIPHASKFVHAFVDRLAHFGHLSTQRVEAQHRAVKLFSNFSRAHLDSIVSNILAMIKRQKTLFLTTTNAQLTRQLVFVRSFDVYKDVSGQIAEDALKLVHKKFLKGNAAAACTGQFGVLESVA